MILVSASSWFDDIPATSAHCSLVMCKQVSSLATSSCLSFSFSFRLGVFHSATRNLEVGLIGRAAEKRSPLLDPVTWPHVLELYSCSAPTVWSLYVHDRVFSIHIEDHIDSWLLYVGCESVLTLPVERMSCYCPSLLNQTHAINDCSRRLRDGFCW